MRRQMKPFVTEYRGSNRRGKESVAGRTEREPPWNGDAPPDPFRAKQDDAGEDGYDAALRAADALFSPKPAASGAPRGALQEPGSLYDHVDGEGASAARLPERRILQAIEEPVVAALRESPAPAKRRGRKPGSKNKPKVALPVTPISADSAMRPPPVARAAIVVAQDAASPARLARRPKATARRDAFGWVRTKLKPGENWKRRLPRVVW